MMLILFNFGSNLFYTVIATADYSNVGWDLLVGFFSEVRDCFHRIK